MEFDFLRLLLRLVELGAVYSVRVTQGQNLHNHKKITAPFSSRQAVILTNSTG